MVRGLLLLGLWFFSTGSSFALEQSIKIGVLSHRGVMATNEIWGPTATYLSEQIYGYRFEIVPLGFDEVVPAVANRLIDFVLVNPGIYVNLEVQYRVSRIATLKNRVGNVPHNQFGGVIFTLTSNKKIQTLEDIRGHSMIAVDEFSFGGYQVALQEIKRIGIDPKRDLPKILFGGIHDRVVKSVESGMAEFGVVRTGILEDMVLAGDIFMDDFRILSPVTSSDFPSVHSTPLYPEWPFSKLLDTPDQLAQQVAVALLNLPVGHPAAQSGGYNSWTIPLEYQPVHDVFRQLNLPPYEKFGRFTLRDAIDRYWAFLLFAFIALVFMGVMTAWVMRLNRQLSRFNQRLERQYELLLNSVGDGIYGVGISGRATFVNRAMEQITGWGPEDLIDKEQHDILHHTHEDGSHFHYSECPVFHTFQDGEARYIKDDIFWCKDGRSIAVEYSSNPIKDEAGEIIGSVVVFRDISERKKAEEESNRHQQELAHVARINTMGEMAAGIAHELNQPLTAIATNSYATIRLLESGGEAHEKIADILERIAGQAERAGEIVRQLRRFVRKDHGDRRCVDINELIRDVALLIRPEVKRAGVTVHLELSPEPIHVWVQDIQIEQVVLNLAMNAIEAMAEVQEGKRQLTITTSKGGNNALIVSVQDSGPGLLADLNDQIFNPFVTTKTNGMGLGLSISQGIVESHDGKLYKEDAVKEGSLFRFVLPLCNQCESQQCSKNRPSL